MDLHLSLTEHEKKVSDFYGTFPYLWSPMSFETVSDPDFNATLIRQGFNSVYRARLALTTPEAPHLLMRSH